MRVFNDSLFGWQEGGFEELLTRLEDHLIVYSEQLVHEQPGAVGAQLHSIAILKNPIPLEILDPTHIRINHKKIFLHTLLPG